ncbi:hypothetical protein F53441_11774 [Fusarium austroafricanum]|uniref:4-hydroxy-2-oxoglutarate aldolase, mitochondrial n=1 Tax=Fusarium austroafricanum TaxID=2364996 RepID=A0A8H4K2E7_9HYPO|nr:hypothetical protein F53441_11774 [Fusarium austroafricanum]
MGSLNPAPSQLPHVPSPGVWSPAVTFFNHEDDTVDHAAQAKYFAHLADSGLNGLIVMGSNAEAFLLTREERSEIIALARKTIGPDFPLMAGVGAHSTKQTLELAEDAHKAGANYLLVLPPAYFGKATSMNVVKRFFSEVARKSPLPIVIYNFPGVTNGVDIDSETIVQIFEESKKTSGKSNIVGVKLTCGSVGKITRLAAQIPSDEFSTYGGQSDFLIGGLAAGSVGCVAAFANVFPTLTAKIYSLYKEGKFDEAFKLQQLAALAERPCKAGVASTKYAVAVYSAKLAGIEGAEEKLAPRHPYEPVGDTVKQNIKSIMKEAGEKEEELLKTWTDRVKGRLN